MKINPRINVLLLAGLMLFLFNYQSFSQCATPSNLTVNNLTPTSGNFDWSSVSTATSYVLKVRPSSSSTWRRITSSNSSETVTGLLPNTSYVAKVRSDCDGIEGNYTAYYYFTTPSNNPCQVPNVYYFTNNDKTANSCRIGWRTINGVTSYYARYKIRYSSDPWVNLPAATNSLQLTGLSPLTQYEFQVQTVCSGGSSAFSSSGIFTTTNSGCGAPGNLSTTNVTTSGATLTWSAVSCALYYQVEYHLGNQPWSSDTTSLTEYTLPLLTQGNAYEFRVSSVSTGNVYSAASPAYPFTTASMGCGQPSTLTSNAVTTNGATLTWTAVPAASSYNVRYHLAGSSSWQTLSANGTSTVIGGLSPDNAYEFQVQSICPSGPGSFTSSSTFVTVASQTSSVPVPDHIVICILENKAYTQLIGSALTPHINALASDPKTAVFTNSYGISHPSQPNYLHLFSGDNQGITNNDLITTRFTTPNLAKELLNVGESFATYSEGLPSVGFDGYSSGQYRRRHNPMTNWMGTGTNQIPSTLNKPYTAFPTSDYSTLPTVSFVVPNLDNDMHDGSLATALVTGDNWIFNNLNAYIQWAKTNNSIFILTTDEDDGSHSNRILTMITGEMVSGGTYTQSINHYSLIRTIAEMYGLNFIGGSANATPLQGCWTNGFRQAAGPVVEQTTVTTADMSGWKIYPNPSRGEVHVAYELTTDAEVAVRIYNSTGAIVHERKLGVVRKGKRIYDLPSDLKMAVGVYFAAITYGDKKYVQRFLVSE